MRVQVILAGICCSILFISCRQADVFEKNTTIPGHKWKSDFAATGSFIIDDTSAYNLYIVLRHTDSYPYNNIWLNVGLQPPGDTMQFQSSILPWAQMLMVGKEAV